MCERLRAGHNSASGGGIAEFRSAPLAGFAAGVSWRDELRRRRPVMGSDGADRCAKRTLAKAHIDQFIPRIRPGPSSEAGRMIAPSSTTPATLRTAETPRSAEATRGTQAEADSLRPQGGRSGSGRQGRAPSVGVVGAGPGGLATAMLLARAGCQVTIYEALPVVGGRTRRLEFGSPDRRFAFDCGPTFFMMPYVLEEIFRTTGRRLSDYAELHRLDPMYRLLLGCPGQVPLRIDATQDLARMAAQLSAIEPSDGPAFLRFIEDNRTKLELMTPILRRPIRGLSDLLTWDTMKVGPSPRRARATAAAAAT